MREYRVFMDGNMWCATASGFVNIQESLCGLGETPMCALGELISAETHAQCEETIHDLCKPDAIFRMGA